MKSNTMRFSIFNNAVFMIIKKHNENSYVATNLATGETGLIPFNKSYPCYVAPKSLEIRI